MLKFIKKAKAEKISLQADIPIELAEALEVIGRGSRSGGLKMILESVKDDIYKAAKRINKAYERRK